MARAATFVGEAAAFAVAVTERRTQRQRPQQLALPGRIERAHALEAAAAVAILAVARRQAPVLAGEAGMHRAQAVAANRNAGAGTRRGAPGVEMDQPGDRLGMGDAGAAAHDLDALDPLQRQGIEIDRAAARGQRVVLAHAVNQDHDVAGIGAAQVQRAESAPACTAVHHQTGLRGQHVGHAAAAPGQEFIRAEHRDVLAGVRRCGRQDAGGDMEGVQIADRCRCLGRLREQGACRRQGQRDEQCRPHRCGACDWADADRPERSCR